MSEAELPPTEPPSLPEPGWSPPRWLLRVLAKCWWLIGFEVLGLLGVVLLYPLSQGFVGWGQYIQLQVAAFSAFPPTHPYLTVVLAAALPLWIGVSYLAHQRLKREEEHHTNEGVAKQVVSVLRKELPSLTTVPWGNPAAAAGQQASYQSLLPAHVPPRFLNVPPRNPYFTGRDEVLKHQHTTLTTDRWALLTQTQAITGLGGIGKTQTALEYAYRYQQDYQTILWAQADTSEALTRACLTLAELLALPEWEAQDQAAIVAALQHWLATHADWLLILDNVEDPALLELVLPAQRSGQVLLTARDPTTGTRARSLPLETLLPEEGALLLLRRAKWLTPEDGLEAAPAEVQAEAKALSETLGGLPLALDQAGAYLEEHGESVAAYQMLFQTYRTRLLNERGRDAVGHVAPVTVTVTLALDLVAQTHPEAAELLYLCAWLAPEGIPEDLFTEGADALPQRLRRVVADPLAWQEVLGALRRSGLLERQPGTKTFSVHRLVQVVLQDGLSAAARKRWAERAVRLVYAIFPDDIKSTDWQRCQQLLPHALACANHIERWHLTSKEAALLLHQAGYSLFERAQYERALLLFQ